MVRSVRILLSIVVVSALLTGVCWAWGTLTSQLPMTRNEESQLRKLIDWYGGENKAQSLSEIVPRRGPHPTHQFIVRQAYLLLQKDPAYKDSPWQLPALESVLAWDGIVRETAESAGKSGMWERRGPGTGETAVYAPPKGPVGGPSADAEITADGNWNPDYLAANHYWNPWIECGRAPAAVSSCYIALLKAMLMDGDENAKGKAASHMCHYLSDTICPKHADMIALDKEALTELSNFANEWFAEHDHNPTITLRDWLASNQVTEALDVIVRESGVALNSPYWQRVNAQIGRRALLTSNTSYVRYTVDIVNSSLRTSVAGLLAVLHERPSDKDLERFYGFFDPFYYNGQLAMMYEQQGDWSPRSIPQFGLTTPAGEHLMWETNPRMGAYIAGNTDKMIRGSKLEDSYVALPAIAGLWSSDIKQRVPAYSEAMKEYVSKAALLQHGSNPLKGDDFDHGNFDSSLSLSVKYVFSALRSCITAIRCDATYAYFPEERKFRVYCDLGNVAEDALRVKAIRVLIKKDGKMYSYPGWDKTVSCSVAKDARQRVTVELPQGKITDTEPQFYVDVIGRYDKTPDFGFWRGEVSERPGRIMHGMSLPAFDRVTGALDLAICFDVTGSMGSSINSVRDNAISVLSKLKARLGDMRVALISFRDIKSDKKDTFSVTQFSPNIDQVIAKMRSWKARGGGDTPEDQLQAIRLALDMWAKTKSDPRKPTKIVVVITDAPPHDPDSYGNTQASIADYAERVDPAHIYPIVVGSDTLAHSKAAELAKLTGGEVLTAKSGDEVASVLAAAVEKAIATHGNAGRAQVPPWMLFYGGLSAVVVGMLWTLRGRRKRDCSHNV